MRTASGYKIKLAWSMRTASGRATDSVTADSSARVDINGLPLLLVVLPADDVTGTDDDDDDEVTMDVGRSLG